MQLRFTSSASLASITIRATKPSQLARSTATESAAEKRSLCSTVACFCLATRAERNKLFGVHAQVSYFFLKQEGMREFLEEWMELNDDVAVGWSCGIDVRGA